MQMTHEEARRLIQFNADMALSTNKKEMLNAHIKGCAACANYAREIEDTEIVLHSAMQKYWDGHPLPLQVSAVIEKISPRFKIGAFMPTRRVLIGFTTVLLFVFVTWQFASTERNRTITPVVSSLAPVPTPSSLLASTEDTFNDCQKILYEIHKGDTLQSIASQFSTSKEAIMELNELQSETLLPSGKLIIPLCILTPTSTIQSPTFTTTPTFELITYTPG